MPNIALAASQGLQRLIEHVSGELDPVALEAIAGAAEVASRMKSTVDLWFAQNATFKLLQRMPELRRRAGAEPAIGQLERLAKALRLAVPHG
jgi:hypothetical protein